MHIHLSILLQASYDVDVPFAVQVCSLEGVEARRRRDSMQPNFDEPFLRDARCGPPPDTTDIHETAPTAPPPLPELYVQLSLVSHTLSTLARPDAARSCAQQPPTRLRAAPALTARTAHRSFGSQCFWGERVALPVLYRDVPRDALLLVSVWDVQGPSRAVPLAAGLLPVYTQRGLLRQGRHKVTLLELGTAHGAAAALPLPPTLPEDLLRGPNLAHLRQQKRARRLAKALPQQGVIPDGSSSVSSFSSLQQQQKQQSPSQQQQGQQKQSSQQQQQQEEDQNVRVMMTNVRPTYCSDELISESELERVEKTSKRLASTERCGWLDAFAYAKIEHLKRDRERHSDDAMHLFLELPTFSHPVVFCEQCSAPTAPGTTSSPRPAATAPALDTSSSSPSPSSSSSPQGQQQQQQKQQPIPSAVEVQNWKWVDAELGLDNPVEAKHLKLARSSHRAFGAARREGLKPNSAEARSLAAILRYPPLKPLTYEDKQLLWNFASYLTKNAKALPKFLQSIDWADSEEIKYAMTMVARWEPVAPEDALLLLGRDFPSEHIRKYAVAQLRRAGDDVLVVYLIELVQAMRNEARATEKHLSLFLIDRACRNEVLGSYFFWYLTLEAEASSFYKDMLALFLSTRPPEHAEASQQQLFIVDKMSQVQSYLKTSGLNRPRQIARIKELLAPGGEFGALAQFPPLPLCVDPTVVVNGIDPDGSYVYKSAMMPIGIAFKTVNWPGPDGSYRYKIIFKKGDDMRQDQLMIQMIGLMDTLLKKENLDLKLTPYRVLATSAREGIVQCINAQSIDHVIKQYDGDIHKYLRAAHPDKAGPFGIAPEVIDTFVKSVAGYSVITYILGVGDRHLDNLMLTPDGNMFHIDFGFILGNENKPFPPPMKICKEMVNGMGGPTSEHYQRFVQYCCETYNILRKSADLIIGLFKLMVDAQIPDLSLDPDRALMKLREKFRLELTDEEASQALIVLINASVTALFPLVVDSVHRFAQYFRS